MSDGISEMYREEEERQFNEVKDLLGYIKSTGLTKDHVITAYNILQMKESFAENERAIQRMKDDLERLKEVL